MSTSSFRVARRLSSRDVHDGFILTTPWAVTPEQAQVDAFCAFAPRQFSIRHR